MSQRKIRLLIKETEPDWTVKSGPAIATWNDMHFLKEEPWLEIKMSTVDECIRDNVIPWVRSGCRDVMLECEKKNWPIIMGPNCVFADSTQPEINKPELTNPAVKILLMNDEINADKARGLCTYEPERIKTVPFFMRPYLYERPFNYEKTWDIYFHVKTSVNKHIKAPFEKITATQHGWYEDEELIFKAEHSAVCVHACEYENYGIAVHEISLMGCPLVYDRMGMKPGSIGEGMGIEVSKIGSEGPEAAEEVIEAVREAMAMDRKKVWEASRAFQDPERLKNIWREALCESLH